MTVTDATMNAEEIGRRVLKLIGSLRDARDLAPGKIEQETGLRVEFNAADPNVYGFGGRLDDDRSYSLVSTPDTLDEKPTSLRFSFDAEDGDGADPDSVCTPSFEAYSAALHDLGFASEPLRAYPGSYSRYFTRGDISVTAYADRDPAGDGVRACLARLIISANA